MHFASSFIWQFLDARATHALRAVAWIAHTSVPDDAPASSAPASPRTFGSTSFLTPGIAVGIWDWLTPSDRTAFQATEWWNHSDLRWFTQGLGVVPASDSDSRLPKTKHSRGTAPDVRGERAWFFLTRMFRLRSHLNACLKLTTQAFSRLPPSCFLQLRACICQCLS